MEAKTTAAPEGDVGPGRDAKANRVERVTAKTISALSVVAGLLGGYFQYLNAYQQQVGEQAKTDMAAATAEFVEISNAYAEAQTLQQRIYFDFLDLISDRSDFGSRKMLTSAGRATFQRYIKAKVELQQNSDVFARKAQIYIDWPSNPGHDAANTKAMDGDPLTESLLDSYNFECDAPANLPHYALPKSASDAGRASTAGKSDDDVCAAANAPKQTTATERSITGSIRSRSTGGARNTICLSCIIVSRSRMTRYPRRGSGPRTTTSANDEKLISWPMPTNTGQASTIRRRGSTPS